ncbi:MAG: hypothetical protein ACYSU6_03925 [Planctomycetota bacterium]
MGKIGGCIRGTIDTIVPVGPVRPAAAVIGHMRGLKLADIIGRLCEKAFFGKKAKRLAWPAHLVYTLPVEIALSHGVASVAVAACGVSSITAWLTQASDR